MNIYSQKGKFTVLICFLITVPAFCQSGGNYNLSWSTIDGGGGTSNGGQYVLMGTIGQPDAANSAGGNYELLGGFWPGGLLCFVDFPDFAIFASANKARRCARCRAAAARRDTASLTRASKSCAAATSITVPMSVARRTGRHSVPRAGLLHHQIGEIGRDALLHQHPLDCGAALPGVLSTSPARRGLPPRRGRRLPARSADRCRPIPAPRAGKPPSPRCICRWPRRP